VKQTWYYTVTGYSFSGRSFPEIAETCVAAGIRGIECAPPLVETLGEAEIRRGGETMRAAGLEVPTFHLPFDARLDIASFYATVRRTAVAELGSWIARAAAVGAKVAILHPTTAGYEASVEGLQPFLDAMAWSVEALLPVAARCGVRLAVENMLPGDGERFFSRPEHVARLRERMSHPSLGFCLDTGHALIAGGEGGVARFLEAMGPGIAAFHLSDTSGDRDLHVAPGRGLVDWKGFFRAAAKLGYPGSMCIETVPFARSVRDVYPVEAWSELVAGTARLAEQALAG
jgi:sugar phosphate isomerase/epimerase